jgi:tetratricopeptide (TPR) repeat protein
VAQQGRAASGNPLDVALCLDALASTHMCRKRYEEAQPLFNRALTIHDETNTANKATADLLTNMAECADLQGRNDKAQPLLERALGIYETLGVREDDPTFVKSKKKLASFKWQRQLSGFCCTSPKTK